jgi:TonB family protein
VLPIASVVSPPVRIAVTPAARALLTLSPVANAIPSAAPAQAGVTAAPVVSPSTDFPVSALLLAAWMAGSVLFLLPVAMGLWQVRSLRRSALPWSQGQSAVDGLAVEAGIRRRVEVLLGALPGPMTCGVAHPAIVLPMDAQTWEAEDLHRALVHELEHVRRADWPIHCLARTACAVYWFHPLVWMAWRRLELEAERSCDDAVLGRSEATAYADQLVGLARRLSTSEKSPLLAMASRADLAARVGAVLDSRQRRGRAGVFAVALACAAAAALVLTVSPLRMVAAEPQDQPPAIKVTPSLQFSGSSLLVITTVVVNDSSGRVVEGLTAGDFAVAENGVPQGISVFEFQKLPEPPPGTPDAPTSYYVLGYYPTNTASDGKFRKITVTRKGDDTAQLHYRPGYTMRTGVGLDGTGSAGPAYSPPLDFTPPGLIYKREPEYSEEARKAKYQGAVSLYVEIDTSGRVVNIRVLRSLGLGLDMKAIEAVKQWRFRPGMKNGSAVAMQAQVTMNFRLL